MNEEKFVVVTGGQVADLEALAAVGDVFGGQAPSVSFIVNVGRKRPGLYHQPPFIAGEVSGKVQLGVGLFFLAIVEGIADTNLVVLGIEGKAVVENLCPGQGNLFSGDGGVL